MPVSNKPEPVLLSSNVPSVEASAQVQEMGTPRSERSQKPVRGSCPFPHQVLETNLSLAPLHLGRCLRLPSNATLSCS